MTTLVSLRPLIGDDAVAVQVLYDASPGYFTLVAGEPAPPGLAVREFGELARHRGRTWLGLHIADTDGTPQLCGLLDMRLAHPQAGTVTIGLLLVRENQQRCGYGTQAYHLVEHWLRQQGYARVRLDVPGQAFGAQTFWRKLGFEFTGEQLRVAAGRKSVRLLVMEKVLAAD